MHLFLFFVCLISIIYSVQAWEQSTVLPLCDVPYDKLCAARTGVICECLQSTLRDFVRSGGTTEVGSLKVECAQLDASPITSLFSVIKSTCEQNCDCYIPDLMEVEDISSLSISASDDVASSEAATQQNQGTESLPAHTDDDDHRVVILVDGQPIENLALLAEASQAPETSEERTVVILVDGNPIENLVLPAEPVPELPSDHPRLFNPMRGIAQQMAAMIFEAQAQGINAAEIAAAIQAEDAEGMSSKTAYELVDSDSTTDDDMKDNKEDDDEDDLLEVAEVLADLKRHRSPPPEDDSDDGHQGWQGSRSRIPRFPVGRVSPPPTRKSPGRGRGGRGQHGRRGGRQKNMCSVRCTSMDKCSVLGDTDICPTDVVCLADELSAGQYFGVGWCTSLSVVAAIGATSRILGRSLEEKQTNDPGGIACPCNESYVSRGCCDSRNGMIWESPGLNLLASLESL